MIYDTRINSRCFVANSDLHNSLRPFLGFRHVVRQAYGFHLDEAKLEELASSFENTVHVKVIYQIV